MMQRDLMISRSILTTFSTINLKLRGKPAEDRTV